MKKITALLLALMMVFAFAACGSSSEQEAEPETTTEAADTSHHVSGLVEDLSNAQLSIFTEANQDLVFNIENADIQSDDGIKPGDTATVEYTGKISNGDTSGCEVTSVIDVAGAETIIEGKVESIDDDDTVTISSNGRNYSFKAKNTSSFKKGDSVKIKYAGIIDGDDTMPSPSRRLTKTYGPPPRSISEQKRMSPLIRSQRSRKARSSPEPAFSAMAGAESSIKTKIATLRPAT